MRDTNDTAACSNPPTNECTPPFGSGSGVHGNVPQRARVRFGDGGEGRQLKPRSFSRLVLVALVAAASLSQARIADAQVDEALGDYWKKAIDLEYQIVGAFKAQMQKDERDKLISDFKVDLDYVQYYLDRVGNRLHEKDRDWTWSSKKSDAIEKAKQAKINLGILQSTVSNGGDMSSDLEKFESGWKELVQAMGELRMAYQSHTKELDDRMKELVLAKGNLKAEDESRMKELDARIKELEAITTAFREDCPSCR
jgi:hypothetical protein